jgi:hypothetical protein
LGNLWDTLGSAPTIEPEMEGVIPLPTNREMRTTW